jgi:predicted phosphodiesterase
MSIAILSDVHGNLEALSAIFNYLEKKKITEIYCLGDIVGYGPNPNECVELISEKCTNAIIGNHDHAALGLTSVEYFNEFAKVSTRWTMNQLTNKSKNYLLSLDFKYGNNSFLLVHSSPSDPKSWNYVLTEEDAKIEFQYFDQPICFIGHSHFPIIFSLKGYTRKNKVKLDLSNKYIVNVGSTGQPRDGDSRACFCLYDREHRKIEYVRIEYDIAKTRDKIVKAGLPMFLADRLKKGF